MMFRISPPWDDPATIISIVVAIVVSSVLLVAIVTCLYLVSRKCKAKRLLDKLKEKDSEESLSLLESKPITSNHKPSYKNIISYLETLKGQKYARVTSLTEKKVDFEIPPLLTTKMRLQTQCAKVDECYICRNDKNCKNKDETINNESSSTDPLDVKLYKRRESCDELGDGPEPEGRLCFSIKYDATNQYLTVNIIKAAYLRPCGMKETADPYVKVELANETTAEHKTTKVIRGTRNPVFNESFAFHVTPEDIYVKTLTLTVCDYDRFSRQVQIGSVSLPLTDIDCIIDHRNDSEEVWWNLEKHTEGNAYQGELMMSLCQMPEHKLIRIIIMRAKGLKLRTCQDKATSSIYVKASVMYKNRVVASKHTRMNNDHVCPMFNEELEFRYHQNKRLSDTYLVLTLCTKTTFGVRRLVGKTVLGPSEYAAGPGYSHWADMLAAPYSTVAQWHVLR